MKLIRLEAIHDRDGAFCKFFECEIDARAETIALTNFGWEAQYYSEELPQAARRSNNRTRLLAGTWPIAPTDELLELRRRVPAVVGQTNRNP